MRSFCGLCVCMGASVCVHSMTCACGLVWYFWLGLNPSKHLGKTLGEVQADLMRLVCCLMLHSHCGYVLCLCVALLCLLTPAPSLPLHVRSLTLHVRSLTLHVRSFTLHVRSLPLHVRSFTLHVRSFTLHVRSLTLHVRSLNAVKFRFHFSNKLCDL